MVDKDSDDEFRLTPRKGKRPLMRRSDVAYIVAVVLTVIFVFSMLWLAAG